MGVLIFKLGKYEDSRGWLTELYRSDQLNAKLMPSMTYISMTLPGIMRGPHEHEKQTDLFFFVGPGDFEVHLWSRTWTYHEEYEAGESNPLAIIVPPRVIHGYKNVSNVNGITINAPNALYGGEGKLYPVDEIRWEESSEFMNWLNMRENNVFRG